MRQVSIYRFGNKLKSSIGYYVATMDQEAISINATKAASSLSAASYRGAVNQLLKSVVREIRTLRSVGTGGGRLPPVTR